jgi:polysaccharide deacetylase 2 family uncharacterized protein YibQ
MRVVLSVLALFALILVVLILSTRGPFRPEPAPVSPPSISLPVPPVEKKVIAVIIDDMGHSPSAARLFIDLDYPLALSFLPNRPHTTELAEEAFRRGKTILMHLPMEPKGYPDINPGPGAILRSMDQREIARIFEEDLQAVPRAVGFNNHMGSEATEDSRVMSEVLRLARQRDLIFVDSRTSPETVGYRMALDMGIPSAERSVFLDNIQSAEAIDEQLDRLLDNAEKNGWALGIGHPYSETARALDRLAFRSRQRGITWVSLEEGLKYAGPGD